MNGTLHTRPLYRLLYKRFRLPRPLVHRGLSALKRVALGAAMEERRSLARELPLAAAPTAVRLDEETGFTRLRPHQIPDATDVARHARAVLLQFRERGEAESALQRNPAKRFLLSVLAGPEFAHHPALLRLMLSRPLLDAASRYLGTVPRLEGAALWWTPPNDTLRSSQAWHIDELAPRQVKVLLNCTTVDLDQGPLHFLPADLSARVRVTAGHRRGRLADADVERELPASAVLNNAGPAGSALMFDSSRCLHFGSRCNRRERLVLAFHFLPMDAPTETRYHLSLSTVPPGLGDLDRHQRLALGLP